MTKKLGAALDMAAFAYNGLTDRGNMPLLAHAMRVAAGVAHLGERAIIVGLLHDAMEDCKDITYDTVFHAFGPEIAGDVDTLTHREGEPYLEYIRRVVRYGGVALAVKRMDNLDNGDPRRLAGLVDHVRERLEKKYAEARIILF